MGGGVSPYSFSLLLSAIWGFSKRMLPGKSNSIPHLISLTGKTLPVYKRLHGLQNAFTFMNSLVLYNNVTISPILQVRKWNLKSKWLVQHLLASK